MSMVAPYVLEYGYRRSHGPLLGRFFAGLRDGRVLGVRTRAGAVVVPPSESDPDTGETLDELVEVAPRGVVTTWSWSGAPRANQLLDRPFAWALIKLDGADTALLHVVDAGAMARMRTGMRVKLCWRAERTGSIKDIACFVPDDGAPQ